MASSRILDSRYFDKLSANRLEALSIKSDNIKPGPDGPGGPGGPSFKRRYFYTQYYRGYSHI